jgi:hypothetical protein
VRNTCLLRWRKSAAAKLLFNFLSGFAAIRSFRSDYLEKFGANNILSRKLPQASSKRGVRTFERRHVVFVQLTLLCALINKL